MVVIECRNVWKVFGRRPDHVRLAFNAIQCEGLDKSEVRARFDCVVAVAGVSFCVERHEVFCIMGLSGSGKSTLLRHLNRLIEPTSGEVLVKGVNINTVSPAELRELRARTMGMVFQNMALFPHRTIVDNVAYGLEIRNMPKVQRYRIALEKLELVRLAGWHDRYPHELSGGMQQRVGLARALAADPDVLLMDEPFSALDPLIHRELQEEFLKIAHMTQKTTVFITHDFDEARRVGDRIAIMKDGEFVQVGRPKDIILHPGNDYVAKFVEGTSTLDLLNAEALMVPITEYLSPDLSELSHCPKVAKSANLDELIDVCEHTDRPIVVVDRDECAVGVVTKEAILRGVRRRRGRLPIIRDVPNDRSCLSAISSDDVAEFRLQ